MLAVLTAIAGSLTLTWVLDLVHLHKTKTAAEIFPEQKPLWLKVLAWLYLTLAAGSWISLSRNIIPAGSVAAAIVTLTAAKFAYLFWNYVSIRHMLHMIWNSKPVLNFFMISSGVAGILTLIAAGMART